MSKRDGITICVKIFIDKVVARNFSNVFTASKSVRRKPSPHPPPRHPTIPIAVIIELITARLVSAVCAPTLTVKQY